MDPAEQRRRARALWPIRRVRLEDEGAVDLVVGTPSELVAMVHQLTLDAFAMAGAEIPDYPRGQAVGTVIRRR